MAIQIQLGTFTPLFGNPVRRRERILIVMAGVLNLGLWVFLSWKLRQLPATIPLHYNIYFGIDLIGPWYQLFVLPGLGFFTLLLNTILARVFSQEPMLSAFLLWTALLTQLIFFAAAVGIASVAAAV